MRTIFASNDIATRMRNAKTKRVDVLSFFPVDHADCACQKLIDEYKKRFAKMPKAQVEDLIVNMHYLKCPADKNGMQHYQITCNDCKEILGYVWATSPRLESWCDFHYYNWTDGEQWKGCLTPNISPIDGYLTIECTCGNDSRDFRANMSISYKQALKIEEKNKVGRKFGEKNSKFKLALLGQKKLKKSTIF